MFLKAQEHMGGHFSKLFLLFLIIEKNRQKPEKNVEIYGNSVLTKSFFILLFNSKSNNCRNLKLSANTYITV